MSLAAFLALVGTIPAKALAGVAGAMGLRSLLNTWLKGYMDGKTAKEVQRLVNEGQQIKTDGEVAATRERGQSEVIIARKRNQSEEKQLRMKYKHEKEIALIAARTRDAQPMTLAAA